MPADPQDLPVPAGRSGPARFREDPVLTGRLRAARVPATYVRRAGLAERLTQGVRDHPLVLVNGPAGAGKTLLVSDWARSRGAPDQPAWLTVEAEDNAPGAFWTAIRQALDQAGLLAPETAGAPLPDPTARPAARLAAELAARRSPVVVVLDEFERIVDPDTTAELHLLLRHADGKLRLVLVGRNEPLLPLHRYRAADEITEIRAADLAFSAEETAELLERHGLALSADGARVLTERTQGWAAGLRLWALAAADAPDCEQYLKEFEAGHSTIADFLLAEVLATQPAETRQLLLRTSILDRIHPALADALTGRRDAERILDGLARTNTFVSWVNGSWYRQHPLFAEILQVHLRAGDPSLPSELHLTAAHWLHRAGLLDDALRHAVAADAWEQAAEWFVEDLAVEQFFTPAGTGVSAALLARMPAGVRGPSAELVRAARALAADDLEAGTAHLDRLAATTAGLPDNTPLKLGAAFLRLVAARLNGSADAAEEAAETVERLRRRLPADRWNEHPLLTVRLLTDLAAARLWAGNLASARATLLAALARADGAEQRDRSEPLALLALVESLTGPTGRAEARARQAVVEVEQARPGGRPAIAHLVLAQVAVERGDLAAARLSARHAVESGADRCRDPLQAVITAVVRSRLALRHGNPRQALSVLGSAEHPGAAEDPSRWARGLTALAASEALVVAGDTRAAVEVLSDGESGGVDHALATARARLAGGDLKAAVRALPDLAAGAPAITTRALLVRAEVRAADGDEHRAQRLVARALTTARPDRLRGPFLEAGP
ncbi:helix-turn-helix transcriptional regulator [Streptomyces tateyamensis]|uniref:Helix-turn-helix transcriptional regulator n=1 Tax=Streptomyces tateyamensis TaxID=565073 RepID=A0A2V4NN70_9ACTN|nr:AAA family ATPase [Streptomyces tateyamensis]PYC77383.1 helix-turn-helix transcriptional regulator [Streptomyces tateyamensis]